MPNHTMRPLTYAEYRSEAQSGDVLLCRATSLEGRMITDITNSTYSHASMAGFINVHRRQDPSASSLMIAESVQHHGKRLIPMSGEIEQYSGYYDVYRPVSPCAVPYDGEAAFSWMSRAANSKYGWSHIWRVLCRRHLVWPFNRLAPFANTEDPQTFRDCSAQIHAALRIHFGPKIREFDCDCEPGDLATLPYVATLFWSYDSAQYARNSLAVSGENP